MRSCVLKIENSIRNVMMNTGTLFQVTNYKLHTSNDDEYTFQDLPVGHYS